MQQDWRGGNGFPAFYLLSNLTSPRPIKSYFQILVMLLLQALGLHKGR
jgi:hypothetical protein